MSYDPNLPQAGTELDAVQIRGQLNGLKDLIDAIVTVSAAQVDAVNTLNPGDPANASVNAAGSTLHFTFGIPRGNDGAQGAQGPPFATAIVDGVSTLNPGDPASVDVNFDGTNVRFTFGIPRGNDGINGSTGNDGLPGQQGPPGEVTNAQLDNAIATTSSNSNGVALLNMMPGDPPSQNEIQQLASKIDELITALRR